MKVALKFELIAFLFFTIFAIPGCTNSSKKESNINSNVNFVSKERLNESPESKYKFVIENSCGFDRKMINENVYVFSSDFEAESALEKIMKLTGLPTNFEIRAASVDNACAVIKCDDMGNCDRYILYNPEFMEKVKDQTTSNYAELAILAHEIAHHLSGHTLSNTGSSYDMELESDKFAGFMLYKLGASIEEAKKAFSTLSVNGSSTHPPKIARITALSNGYYEAKRNREKIEPIFSNSEISQTTIEKKQVKEIPIEKSGKSKKNDSWSIYHRICSKNGKFWVTTGQETAICTGCKKEYYLRWSGGIDINTGKQYVFEYSQTESSLFNDLYEINMKNYNNYY
jgi:hypothetical protein